MTNSTQSGWFRCVEFLQRGMHVTNWRPGDDCSTRQSRVTHVGGSRCDNGCRGYGGWIEGCGRWRFRGHKSLLL